MTDAARSPRASRRTGAASGTAALRAAGWLGLAAAPTFLLMAMATALSSGQPDALCMATPGAPPWSGMTGMYLLMGAFHLAPWLRKLSWPPE